MKDKYQNKKITNLKDIIIYIILWSILIILFWVLLRYFANPFIVYILLYYVGYPIMATVFSYRLFKKSNGSSLRWLLISLVVALNGSAWYITYGLTNMLGESNIASPGIEHIIINVIAVAIGLVAGKINRE